MSTYLDALPLLATVPFFGGLHYSMIPMGKSGEDERGGDDTVGAGFRPVTMRHEDELWPAGRCEQHRRPRSGNVRVWGAGGVESRAVLRKGCPHWRAGMPRQDERRVSRAGGVTA